jgi:hypothetical protein
VLPWTQGNTPGTGLDLIPRSNQTEIAQLIEITTLSPQKPRFQRTNHAGKAAFTAALKL